MCSSKQFLFPIEMKIITQLASGGLEDRGHIHEAEAMAHEAEAEA
jgi:hypothetical protein